MRRGLFVAASLTLALGLTASSADAQTLLFDGYDTSIQTSDLSYELAARQTGDLAPIGYQTSYQPAQTLGYGTGVLRLAVNPSGGNLVSFSPNHSFTEDPGANGYMYVKFDVEIDSITGWVSISVGEPTFRSGWSGASAWDDRTGYGALFTGTGGSTSYNGITTIASKPWGPTAGVHPLELRIYDPGGGNPFDGTGATSVDVYWDGSTTPHFTFTRPSPGFTQNVITIWGEASGGTRYHRYDNFEVGLAEFPSLAVTPPNPSFGPTQAGDTSDVQAVTLTNDGSIDVDVTSISTVGPNASLFNVSAGTCVNLTPSLTATASCDLSVTFNPTTEVGSPFAGTLRVTSNAGITDLPLTGIAVPPSIDASPSALVFPSTPIGTTSAAKTLNLTNDGVGSVDVASIATLGANASLFTVGAGTCGTLTPTLGAGAACALSIAYRPTSTEEAPHTAGLRIVSDSGTTDVVLTGGALSSQSIPTLSEWGMLVLFALLAAAMFGSMRRTGRSG